MWPADDGGRCHQQVLLLLPSTNHHQTRAHRCLVGLYPVPSKVELARPVSYCTNPSHLASKAGNSSRASVIRGVVHWQKTKWTVHMTQTDWPPYGTASQTQGHKQSPPREKSWRWEIGRPVAGSTCLFCSASSQLVTGKAFGTLIPAKL